ncbi:dienelactone hydrolase family protein [bacterium]|nr:dienelactone hydrolase family protein [bacterium]
MIPRLCFTAALVAVLVASAPSAFAGPEVKKSEKGIVYSIRFPQDYDKAKGAVLVIGFHGRGGNQVNFMDALERYSFLKSALLVTANAPKEAMWDASDLPAIGEMILELQRAHRPPRTIVCGFSAGGYFSFGVGTTFPDRVQAAVPMSGGLIANVKESEALKKVAFYVIHGDADDVVKVEQSRTAVKRLETAGVAKLKYDEIPGLKHSMDEAAIKRAFEWIEKSLGPAIPQLTDQEAAERIRALEAAVKAKDADGIYKGLGALAGAPRSLYGKIVSLAKAQTTNADDNVALAAIDLLGGLGEDGVSALKAVPHTNERTASAACDALAHTGAPAAADALLVFLKGKPEPVAAAAARALADLGGDASIKDLIVGLAFAEPQKAMSDRQEAINASLKKLTGQSFTTSKDWKKWAAGEKK